MKFVTVYKILYEIIDEFLDYKAFCFWKVLFSPLTEVFQKQLYW